MTESSIDWGIVLSLIGVGLAILGIGAGVIASVNKLRTKLLEVLGRLDNKTEQLAPIRDDVVAVRQSVADLFTMSSNFFTSGQSGTVSIELQNLGRTSVSADPGPAETKYDIRTSSLIISAELVSRLAKDTGFEQTEIEAFGEPIRIMGVGRDRLIATLPSTDARICADFISRFLDWLDSTYFEERQKMLDAFEKPIER